MEREDDLGAAFPTGLKAVAEAITAARRHKLYIIFDFN